MTPGASAGAGARVADRRHAVAPAARPFTVPARPRRVSGPARTPRGRTAPAGRAEHAGIAIALPAAVRGLPLGRLLDRLLTGKAWIGAVAFALIGIVALQLALLHLNSSIGRSLERGAVLQRQNAALSIENSEVAAGARVESRAAAIGMQLVPSGALRFLAARPSSDPARAAGALNAPVQRAPAAPESTSSSGPAGGTEAGAASSTPAGAATPGSGAEAANGAAGGGAAAAANQAAGGSAGTSSTGSGATSAVTPAAEAPPSSSGAGGGAAAATPPAAATAEAPATGAQAPPTSGSAEASPAGGTVSGPGG